MKCETSWNAPVHARTSPAAIGKERLARFTGNDPVLARQYAVDSTWLAQNGAKVVAPPWAVKGPDVAPGQTAQITVASHYPGRLRAAKVLCKKLGLSQKAFREAVALGHVKNADGLDLLRCALRDGLKLEVATPAAWAESGRTNVGQ